MADMILVWDSTVTTIQGDASSQPQPAEITIDATVRGQLDGEFIWVQVDDNDPITVELDASVDNADIFTALSGIASVSLEIVDGNTLVKSISTGTSATLHIRGGNYGTDTTPVYSTGADEGYTEEGVFLEARTYVWTWVYKVAGFEFESAPSVATNIIDVDDGQTSSITNMPAAPLSGYTATHKRIYRAVSGVFLFVAEIPFDRVSYSDSMLAADLGEPLPSITWALPKAGLRGLTALPSGTMAAFVGHDIYFCEPFRPYAWPENYALTVEHKIVGLGRMDSTLAVLTTGNPVFIQGLDPGSMTMVKTDLEQSCVSKRSIVSYGPNVFYASPDGLMKLSPGGSGLVTETMFTNEQWQRTFNPSSIHAYQHDGQYIAFYDTGTVQGGFMYDMKSGQFVTHDISATAGYTDLETDTLFLAFSDATVKKWERGSSAKTYIWTSKTFTQPQPIGYTVGQVEAEAYNITMKIYGDTALLLTKVVTSRDPFRLPAGRYRDWAISLTGSTEVFSVAIATSPSELAND